MVDFKSTVVLCLWVLAGFMILIFLLLFLLDMFDAKLDAPAWVQAIGSIAAVLVAVIIANKESRNALRAKRQQREVVFRLVNGVAHRTAQASRLLFQNFQVLHEGDKAAQVEVLAAVEEHLLAMRGINPVDLPMAEMVEPFLKIRGALEQSVVMARLLSETQVVDRIRCATALVNSSQIINLATVELAALSLD